MVITGKAAMQFMGDWAKGEFTAANLTPGKEYGCAVVGQALPDGRRRVRVRQAEGSRRRQGAGGARQVVLDPETQIKFDAEEGLDPDPHRRRRLVASTPARRPA